MMCIGFINYLTLKLYAIPELLSQMRSKTFENWPQELYQMLILIKFLKYHIRYHTNNLNELLSVTYHSIFLKQNFKHPKSNQIFKWKKGSV